LPFGSCVCLIVNVEERNATQYHIGSSF
jgi:hypothetical protein